MNYGGDDSKKYYKLYKTPLSYHEAELVCERDGASIANFETLEDLQNARTIVGKLHNPYRPKIEFLLPV